MGELRTGQQFVLSNLFKCGVSVRILRYTILGCARDWAWGTQSVPSRVRQRRSVRIFCSSRLPRNLLSTIYMAIEHNAAVKPDEQCSTACCTYACESQVERAPCSKGLRGRPEGFHLARPSFLY